MTALDLDLTPAQWEHYDRHGWTLTEAPEDYATVDDVCAQRKTPVPATVPCPECDGKGVLAPVHASVGDICTTCKGSGGVPRTVGIIHWDDRGDSGPFPAERAGTATVTAVPVVGVNDLTAEAPYVRTGPLPIHRWANAETLDDLSGAAAVTALFATPPKLGTTVWRLDKANNR